MKFGAVFPQIEFGNDPVAIRDYAQAAEGMGFEHIIVYDHVVGANAASRPGWSGAYNHNNPFHEPFVFFGYLAGVTETIGLVTAVIILPQRQTALVAKQAAEVDVLSGGRLRLGIGTGWNQVEYEALGENFHNRGRRSEEQIKLMRQLWTNELVTFDGRWHKVTDAGINPLPVQRPIPVWLGGSADQVIKRVATIADGWFPAMRPDDRVRAALDRIRSLATEAGRDPADIGIQSSVSIRESTPDDWRADIDTWRELGATHMSVNTMNAGITTPQGHIDAIRKFNEAVD
ncbi:MAG: LLM class F420-dependent oxidoreductase [SAR202 cluster bacterium]|nr:LLM class F420-dependent oxidoreductase [SAR202 cluster bacterium]MDP7104246.1 LLM class F420-dependent oxidoreductase [SAR202 cluster bacterium]MDP7532834.1 LLM class F420-dependent oxidoreductase [SAR202 cluster bacterium]